MRVSLKNDNVVAHPVKKHRLQNFEQMTDILTVALVAGLGVAMVIGLMTASGAVTW